MKLTTQKSEGWDQSTVKISRSYLRPFLHDTPFYRLTGDCI